MGWRDDPVESAQPAWSQDPVAQPAKRYGTGKSLDVQADGSLVPSRSDYGQHSYDTSVLGDQAREWGQAAKNVAQAGAQATTGITGAIAGDVAGLGALVYDTTANAVLHPFSGSQPSQYADPAAVRERVASALTYQPQDPNNLTAKVLQAPGKMVSGAGDFMASWVKNPYAQDILRAVPQAVATYLGVKSAMPVRSPQGVALPKEIAWRPSPDEPPVQAGAVPKTAELQAAKQEAYKKADAAGVVITPESTRRVVTMFKSVAKTENLGKLPPKIRDAANILNERIAKKEPLSLMDADKVRQLINDAKRSNDAADVRLAKVIQSKYDDYLDNLSPGDVMKGNAKEGAQLLKDARELHRRFKKSEMIDDILNRSDITGDVNYTQAGQELAIRREFAKIAKDKDQMKFFTKEEQTAILNIVKPGPRQKFLINLGKLDPSRGGMAAALSTGIGGGLGGVAGAAIGGIPGAGAGAIGGNAVLGAAANVANRYALKGTRANVEAARKALVKPGIP